MANLKNWTPEMTDDERDWFDRCPKAVLFEIARQFGMRIGDDFTPEGAFKVMTQEWVALHLNRIVPQRPYDPEKMRVARSRKRLRGETHPRRAVAPATDAA